jgi:transcriptional regulator with XRE-family HTH domain
VTADPLQVLCRRETTRQILDLLEPIEIVIAWLRCLHYSDPQIAEVVGISRQAVQQRMDRARYRLVDALPELRYYLTGRTRPPSRRTNGDFTVPDLAEALQISMATVRVWLAEGRFPGAYRADSHRREWRIPFETLLHFRPKATSRRPDFATWRLQADARPRGKPALEPIGGGEELGGD